MSSLTNTPKPVRAAVQRVALCVEYDGSEYSGWQLQRGHNNVVSVQATLETALSKIADAPVRVHCAGRTDSGVHASGQVVHFEAPSVRDLRAWRDGTNSRLPASVVVHSAQQVSEDFHARFSAIYRRYRYLVLDSPVRSALMAGHSTWVREELDVAAMNLGAQALLGEQDFSAFRAASCQSSTAMRCVDAAQVYRRAGFVVFDIRANAFLHHMVRNIVGSLIAVGRGRQSSRWIGSLLHEGDRRQAAATAPPQGLYLVEVGYPGEFGLTLPAPGPAFLGPGPGGQGEGEFGIFPAAEVSFPPA